MVVARAPGVQLDVAAAPGASADTPLEKAAGLAALGAGTPACVGTSQMRRQTLAVTMLSTSLKKLISIPAIAS
jgi:hypothetical protein